MSCVCSEKYVEHAYYENEMKAYGLDDRFHIEVETDHKMWNHSYKTSITIGSDDAKRLVAQLNEFIAQSK